MLIELHQDVARPPLTVYEYLVDPGRLGRWVEGLASHEPLPGPAGGAGARFRQELAIAGARYPFEGEVTEDEPGRVFGYRLEHKEARLAMRFELERVDLGTLLRQTSRAELRSLRLKVVSGLVERFLREQMAGNLARLARAVEAES
jgi:uncharacterized protein YndB with AHSA1/START domain